MTSYSLTSSSLSLPLLFSKIPLAVPYFPIPSPYSTHLPLFCPNRRRILQVCYPSEMAFGSKNTCTKRTPKTVSKEGAFLSPCLCIVWSLCWSIWGQPSRGRVCRLYDFTTQCLHELQANKHGTNVCQQAGIKTYLRLLGTQREAVSLETVPPGRGLVRPSESSAVADLMAQDMVPRLPSSMQTVATAGLLSRDFPIFR